VLPAHRTLLIETIPRLFSDPLTGPRDFANVVRDVGKAAALGDVPVNATYSQLVTVIVDTAVKAEWIGALVDALVNDFPARDELITVQGELARETVKPTSKEPFDEVWLDGDRPFVNRRSLRNVFLRLSSQAAETVLLVDGADKSGKTFSYFLLNHAAVKREYLVHKFEVRKTPQLPALARDVMVRVGMTSPVPPQGPESAERWAEDLAGGIADAIRKDAQKRFLVFDEFGSAPPPETLSFVVRLAQFADEELRPFLRVVLVKFPGVLPPELEDVVAREDVQPFSVTDMVAAMLQISNARGWGLTEATLKLKVDEFEAGGTRSLRERFNFVRNTIRDLALKAAAAGGPT
jgi:hypothetical protein